MLGRSLRNLARLSNVRKRTIKQSSIINLENNDQSVQVQDEKVLAHTDFFKRALERFPPGSTNSKSWPLAFAYGSGVFEQEGNTSPNNMTDFILVVEDSEKWHQENLVRNPKDYSRLLSILGSKAISKLQDDFPAKCYFNTLVPFEDGQIKYGVINRNNLIADLLDWESLYIAGRLQKPVRIIEKMDSVEDSELAMALRMNLKNALHTALLLLPAKFSEKQLYKKLVGLSYQGDFRMRIAEDQQKVNKITNGSFNELRALYMKQLAKMSEFIYIHEAEADQMIRIDQDISPGARHHHLTMLPKNMQEMLVRCWDEPEGKFPDVEDILRSAAYHRGLDDLIANAIGYIVARPAFLQAGKGILTAGVSKAFVYSSKKIAKKMKR